MDAHDHVVFGRVGVGDVGQREPGSACGTVSYGDGLHNGSLLRRIQILTRPLGRLARHRFGDHCTPIAALTPTQTC